MGSTPAGVISKEPRASGVGLEILCNRQMIGLSCCSALPQVDESNRVEEIQCVSVCDNWWYIEGAKVGQNSKNLSFQRKICIVCQQKKKVHPLVLLLGPLIKLW